MEQFCLQFDYALVESNKNRNHRNASAYDSVTVTTRNVKRYAIRYMIVLFKDNTYSEEIHNLIFNTFLKRVCDANRN